MNDKYFMSIKRQKLLYKMWKEGKINSKNQNVYHNSFSFSKAINELCKTGLITSVKRETPGPGNFNEYSLSFEGKARCSLWFDIIKKMRGYDD